MTRCIFLCLFATAASAESPIADVICAPSAQMEQRLTQQLGTSRHATGLRSPEEVVEIWTDQRGGWTMVVSYASGRSCIVAMGDHWSETGTTDPT
jgi:hypothetical protein